MKIRRHDITLILFQDIFDAYRCKECDGPVIPSNSNDLSGVCRKCGAICDLKIQLASQNYADGIFEQGMCVHFACGYKLLKCDLVLGLLHLEGGNLKQALSTFRQSEVQFLQNLYCHSSKIGRLYDTMARCYAEYGMYRCIHDMVLICIAVTKIFHMQVIWTRQQSISAKAWRMLRRGLEMNLSNMQERSKSTLKY